MQRSFFDEVMYKSTTSKCFCGHGLQNDGFVKVTDVYFDGANVLLYFFKICSNKRCIFSLIN